MIKQLKCIDGILTLYEDRVTIEPKGIGKLNKGLLKGKKEILIDSISAIQFKPGTFALNGYLQFTLAGGNESTRGALEAAKDENSIIIKKKQNKDAEFIKEKIYELKAARSGVGQVQPTSNFAQIKELKELLDMGAITQEEFDAKKAELL